MSGTHKGLFEILIGIISKCIVYFFPFVFVVFKCLLLTVFNFLHKDLAISYTFIPSFLLFLSTF